MKTINRVHLNSKHSQFTSQQEKQAKANDILSPDLKKIAKKWTAHKRLLMAQVFAEWAMQLECSSGILLPVVTTAKSDHALSHNDTLLEFLNSTKNLSAEQAAQFIEMYRTFLNVFERMTFKKNLTSETPFLMAVFN